LCPAAGGPARAPVPGSVLPLIHPQGPASATTSTGANHNFVTAIYAQEQWTVKRATLSLGVRYDSMHGKYDPYTTIASNFLPSQTLSGADDSPNWKDIAPRLAVAYDAFGTAT